MRTIMITTDAYNHDYNRCIQGMSTIIFTIMFTPAVNGKISTVAAVTIQRLNPGCA